MTKRANLDPVTRYATDVVAGREIAGRLVRLACQRHLTDLEQATAKGLLWKPAEAQEAIDFFPEVLCLPEETDADEDEEAVDDVMPKEGTLFVLSPFQQFIVGSLFGWFAYRISKKTGARRLQTRFRIAYFEGAKGCGKTPMGAGILIYMLIRHGVRGAQLFCAAVTKDQAKVAFADCEKMVQSSPALRSLIDVKVNNLAVLSTGSFIRPISSEKRGLDGKRVQGAVIDELHEHATSIVVVKVRAGIKGRPNALIFIPTNSGFDRESVCWEYHDYSRQVLEGLVVNEAWFAYVCHLDACDVCQKAGKLQPSDDCPNCDDWKTEGPHWLKANPNLGVSLPWQYLREQVREAIDIPSQRNMIRRLNFCQWTQQATVWIPPEQWAACEATHLTAESLQGRECYVGIDLSDHIDLSSVALCFPRPLTPEEKYDAMGETTNESADREPEHVRDHAVDLLVYFWMPRDTLYRRANEDKIPYPEWEKAGYVNATPGPTIDHDAIVDFIINDVATKYRIRGIGFDQAGAAAAVTRLSQHFGKEMVIEIPQSFSSLNDPSRTLEALVISGHLHHDGNKAMAWCMANMAIEENRWFQIRPVKINQRKRIDGGVAAIDGLAFWRRHPVPPAPQYQAMVFGGRP